MLTSDAPILVAYHVVGPDGRIRDEGTRWMTPVPDPEHSSVTFLFDPILANPNEAVFFHRGPLLEACGFEVDEIEDGPESDE